MGGGVLVKYLQLYSNKFKKAVFTAPMFKLVGIKIPTFLQLAITFPFSLIAPKSKLFTVKKHPYVKPFEKSSAGCLERYNRYNEFRKTDADYSVCNPTNRWSYEALKTTTTIFKKGEIEKLTLPILVYSADAENLVDNKAHVKFVKRLPNGIYKRVKNSKHEIFNSKNAVLKPYVTEILKFFS
jgi:lysophospholipase